MNPVRTYLASNYSATGASTTTPAFFPGGIASYELIGTVAGTVTLQKLSADDATWQAVGSSTTIGAAGFVQGLNLPAGAYRLSCSATLGPIYATLSASLD